MRLFASFAVRVALAAALVPAGLSPVPAGGEGGDQEAAPGRTGKRLQPRRDRDGPFPGDRRRGPAHVERVTQVLREVLLDRGRDYFELGLAGIAPYARKGGKLASPRDELMAAVESARFLEEHFPDFHAALREFPEHRASLTESRCHWLKKEVDKRPVSILARQLLSVRDDMALGAERESYVGHTYNSMLMLIGCLPFEGGTLVFGANRVFTEKVTGFGSGIRKKTGRKVVGEKMAQCFQTARTVLERRQPPTP